jgi:hypothetical protein
MAGADFEAFYRANYALSGLRRAGYRRRVVERLAQRAEPVPAASAEVVDMVAALRQREVLVLFYVVELRVALDHGAVDRGLDVLHRPGLGRW